MIESWARVPVTLSVIAVLAVITLLVMVGAPFVPMMAGPEDAR
jgi:hypothetical protein